MSFAPTTQQANSADANRNANLNTTASSSSQSVPALVAEGTAASDVDLQFKQRTFDVVWVEKKALMYREGISKVGFKKDGHIVCLFTNFCFHFYLFKFIGI